MSARLAGTLGIPAPPALSSALSPAAVQEAAAAAAPTSPEASAPAAGGNQAPASTPTESDKQAIELERLRLENMRLWRSVSKRFTKLMIAGTEWGLEAFGREAGDPDDDDVKDFQKALESQLGVWFGPKELTPLKQMFLSGTFIVGEMAMSSTAIPPKPKDPKQLPAQPPAPNAATTPAPDVASGSAPILRPV